MKNLSLVVIALFFAGFVAGVAVQNLPITIRYRLTVHVQADGVLHTSSGVVETRWSDQLLQLPGTTAWAVGVRGEAVAVDLGTHGTVFLLLTGDLSRRDSPPDPQTLLIRSFAPTEGSTKDVLRQLANRHEKIDLHPLHYLC
jgi:hypothetical protein